MCRAFNKVLIRTLNGLAPVVLAAILLCLSPSTAFGGTYKMYSCNVPGRNIAKPTTGPWQFVLDGLYTRAFDGCAHGGDFGIGLVAAQPYMRQNSWARLTLARPAHGPMSAIGIMRYKTWLTADLSGSGAPAFISDGGFFAPPGGSTPDGAPWTSPPLGVANDTVHVQLYCSSGAPGDCQFNSTTPLRVRGIEVDLHENVAPSGSIDGGTILAGVPLHGRRSLLYTAIDEESGVARVDLLFGSTVIATTNLAADASVCPSTGFGACPSRHSGELSVDVNELGPGTYPVSLRITDAAGNFRVLSHAAQVVVAGPSTPSATSSGPKAQLSVGFAVTSRGTHTTPYGRSVRIRGRLQDAAGRPINRGRLTVLETFDAGRRPRTMTITTGADGRYAYVLSGAGPSRRIQLKYVNAGAAVTSARTLRLAVRATSTLDLVLRGTLVQYSGRVLSGPMPRGGKRVFIQGRARGGSWQRFASRRTTSAGRFSGRYRLRVRRPGVRLQFRVEIPRQAGYGYAPRTGPLTTRVVR